MSRVGRDLQVRVPAGQALWLTDAAPIDEVTGTYVVQIGNDTYHFTDMTVDVPVKDDGRKAPSGSRSDRSALRTFRPTGNR